MGADVARCAVLAALHLLALPARLVFWLADAVRAYREYQAIAGGTVRCPAGHLNETNILGRCRRCGFTCFGSRLHCPECGFIALAISCDVCGATIRVFSKV